MSPMNIHFRRLIQFLFIGPFLLAYIVGSGAQIHSPAAKARAAHAQNPTVTITVNPSVTIESLNFDFLGFAAETANTCIIVNLAQNDPEFVQLLKNFLVLLPCVSVEAQLMALYGLPVRPQSLNVLPPRRLLIQPFSMIYSVLPGQSAGKLPGKCH